MGRTHLFLVNRRNEPLSAGLRISVEAAYRWACSDYPTLDRALIATWTEEVGRLMADRAEIQEPRRYAFAALHGKIRQHFRSGPSKEVPSGISEQLEEWADVDEASMRQMEQRILFQEVSSKLNERDRDILGLLDQGFTSPTSVGDALGLSYNAAAKAIQRTKERTRAILTGRPNSRDPQEHDESA